MKKRLFSLLTLCLLLALAVSAEPVTRQQALTKAKAFLAQKGITLKANRPAYAPAKDGSTTTANLYVFNAGQDRGYVIISGDDATPAVLGYTDSGTFDEATIPDNMRSWLKGYEQEIAYVSQHPEAAAKASPTVKQAVTPFVETLWDQSEPFNNNCPVYNGSDKAVTGCVATAMAQALYYCKYPSQTLAEIPAYTTSSYRLSIGAIAKGTKLDWDNMVPTYTNAYGEVISSVSDAQKSAVATLMQVCGSLVHMDYGPSSGAPTYDIATQLQKYLGYPSTVRHIYRSDYAYAGWVDIIYAEMAAKRPVIVSGQSSGSGHAFIVDGYDGDQLFHINWGWGGMSNGYYLLSVVEPDNKGIGGGSSTGGYSAYQDATIGISPESVTDTKTSSLPLTNILSCDANGNVSVRVTNYTGEEGTFEFSLGYIDADGNIQQLPEANTKTATINNQASATVRGLSASGALPGDVKIYVLARVQGTTTWLIPTKTQWMDAVKDESGDTYHYDVVSASDNFETSLAFGDVKETGSPCTVTATLKNTTGTEYNGKVYWFVSTSTTRPSSANNWTGVTVLGGNSTTTSFTFSPSTAGTYHVWLTDASGNTLATSEVTISSGEAQSQVYITGLSANGIDQSTQREGTIKWGSATESGIIVDATSLSGDALTITFGTTSAFTGKLTVKIGSYGGRVPLTSTYSLEVSSYTGGPIDFTMNSWLSSGKYRIQLFNGSTQYGKNWYINIVDGGACWIDGEKTTFTLTNGKYTIPENATAADLTGLTTDTKLNKVVPNSNPNTVYYLRSTATVPTALSGKNIVKDAAADAITITDGYGFLAPIAFTATKATYSRKIDQGTTGKGGWSTITLPFEATSVTADGTAVGWFQSATDQDKQFWLEKLSGIEGTTLSFDYAGATLEANTPYIIAIPADTWGSDYDLRGKTFVFSADNVSFSGTTTGNIVAGDYNFRGYYSATTAAQRYALNDEGTLFVLGNEAAEPFRAYFEPRTLVTALPPVLTIGNGTVTAISKTTTQVETKDNNAIYNLQGQRVSDMSQKGIYIINGKKIIKR